MDISEKSSNFAINSSFQKLSKTICDKKSKGESVSTEIQWLQDQLDHKNPKICENSVNILIATSETGFVLNSLISSLPKLKSSERNYEIIVDSLFRILLEDVSSTEYKCSFDVHQRIHPMIFLVDESSEKMLYFTQKINSTLESMDKNVSSNAVKFLKPVLLKLFCSDQMYSTGEIWKSLDGRDHMKQLILSMRRTVSPSSVILFNSMVQTMHENNPTNDTLLLLIHSTSKLVCLSLDPTDNFRILLSSNQMIALNGTLNVVLLMLADMLQNTSINHISGLLELFQSLLIVPEKSGNYLINVMILDGLIQILACSTKHSETIGKVVDSIQSLKDDTKQITDPEKLSLFSTEFCPEIANAVDLAVFIERLNFSIKPIKTSSDRYFWIQHQLLLRGLFHCESLDFESWKIAFYNLIEVSKDNEILKTSLIMPLLYKLAHSTNPRVKLLILRKMIDLGKMTEIFGAIKALSFGLIRSTSIDLILKLWRVEPRTYPLLYKVLVETSPTDAEDYGLEIVRAAAVREICDLRPQHGSDLVSLISEIINSSLDSKEGEIPTALAIDSIILLCQNHVINVMSAWKAISKPMTSERRTRVVKSLCNFFAIVPQFKRANVNYESFSKDILAIIWHMVQNGNRHETECALSSLKNWKYDQMTLDTIPPIYREGIAMPEAPSGMEVSILDLEVPGECYVQLLTKIHPDARHAARDLIIHYVGCEILEFRSGHYLVKEGQPEPQNYKSLLKQSILKAITTFVHQQATTQNADKRVEEIIVIEALKILAHKYPRQLPPLNWYFLHDFVTQTDKMRVECFKIVAKQSSISGTAKTLIENFLTCLDRENALDVEIALNVLVDCCNGVSTAILGTFCDFIFMAKSESFIEVITNFMQREKEVTVKEHFLIVLSSFLTHNQCTKEFARSIPPKYFDSISTKLTADQKLQFRMEILKSNENVENQISWMNEMINEQMVSSIHRDMFKDDLFVLFTSSDVFPKKRFILDFIIMTQNRMVEDDFESEKLHFLLEIFIISIVSFSGYFCLNDSMDFNGIFPQSLELISRQKDFDDSTGRILEFLIHIIPSDKVNENLRKTFKNSLKYCKNHDYFKKPKFFHKCLDLLTN